MLNLPINFHLVFIQIYLPTGGHVKITSSEIRLYPSVHDMEKTRGLCGSFNFECNDDFEMRDGSYFPGEEARDDCSDHDERYAPNGFSEDWRCHSCFCPCFFIYFWDGLLS